MNVSLFCLTSLQVQSFRVWQTSSDAQGPCGSSTVQWQLGKAQTLWMGWRNLIVVNAEQKEVIVVVVVVVGVVVVVVVAIVVAS